MLLLHEFHRRKFLLPDKPDRASRGVANRSSTAPGKRHSTNAPRDASTPQAAPLDTDEATPIHEAREAPLAANAVARSKGPQYAGAHLSHIIVCRVCANDVQQSMLAGHKGPANDGGF
jgi:hypothetical protein